MTYKYEVDNYIKNPMRPELVIIHFFRAAFIDLSTCVLMGFHEVRILYISNTDDYSLHTYELKY
jgi:hypothetical protein